MPSYAQNVIGAWRLMFGKADGLRRLDLSADGFWNSFFAMVVALPPLFVSWTGYANEACPGPELYTMRMALLPRLALVDFAVWVLPLVALALVARPAGIADRFVHYVVASNWASAIIVWLTLPIWLLSTLAPSAGNLWDVLSLAFFVASLVLTWRLTNAAIGKGPGVATAVFGGMLVVSFAVLIALQALLNIPAIGQPAG